MVGADGGCGYHLDVRLCQQVGIAFCAGADYHAVGVAHGLGGYFLGCEISHGGILVEQAGDVGDIALYDEPYITVWHTNNTA